MINDIEDLYRQHQNAKDRKIKLKDYIEFNADYQALGEIEQAFLQRELVLLGEYEQILDAHLKERGEDCSTLSKTIQDALKPYGKSAVSAVHAD